MMRWIACVCVAVAAATVVVSAAEEKKKIVLVAGKDSHGRGEHEFRALRETFEDHVLLKVVRRLRVG